jgi:hypothetical protein
MVQETARGFPTVRAQGLGWKTWTVQETGLTMVRVKGGGSHRVQDLETAMVPEMVRGLAMVRAKGLGWAWSHSAMWHMTQRA